MLGVEISRTARGAYVRGDASCVRRETRFVAFAIAGRMPPKGRKGSCAATVPAPSAAVLVTGPFVASPARGRLLSEVWRSFARVWRQSERASGPRSTLRPAQTGLRSCARATSRTRSRSRGNWRWAYPIGCPRACARDLEGRGRAFRWRSAAAVGVAPDRLCLDRVYLCERFVNAAHRVVASPRGAGPERRGKFKTH